VTVLCDNDSTASLKDRIEKIDETFSEAEHLAKSGSTMGSAYVAFLTDVSIVMVLLYLPFAIIPSTGMIGILPVIGIAILFSLLNTLSRHAENPFGDDFTDIHVHKEFTKTKRLVEDILEKDRDAMTQILNFADRREAQEGSQVETLMDRSRSSSDVSRTVSTPSTASAGSTLSVTSSFLPTPESPQNERTSSRSPSRTTSKPPPLVVLWECL